MAANTFTDSRVLMALLVMLCALAGCQRQDSAASGYLDLRGQTMGTYYALRYRGCSVSAADVEARLHSVNQSMSTYIEASELSAFNRSNSTDWTPVSPALAEVLAAAQEVWRRSAGAFDVTVGPLVNLWGFGAETRTEQPDEAEQQAAAQRVGMHHLALELERKPPRIRKKIPDLFVDLSALAKGYAVDRIALLLAQQGCTDYMVDIGGELRLAGNSPRGGPWRIGVEAPEAGWVGRVQSVLTLSDISVATSGDYRNFRLLEGRRVDHVFDPRTALPADNAVASVTVLHDSAMWADAWATALMVLGGDAGLALAEEEGLPVYLLLGRAATGSSADGGDLTFEQRYNDLITPHLR